MVTIDVDLPCLLHINIVDIENAMNIPFCNLCTLLGSGSICSQTSTSHVFTLFPDFAIMKGAE